jgi:hypothetical protein
MFRVDQLFSHRNQLSPLLQIVDKLFRLIDLDSDGIVTPPQIMELIAALSNSR